MRNLLTILVAAAVIQTSARTVSVPTMPVSPYFVSEPASGARNLSVEMHLDIRYAQQQVKRINVTGINASAFGELVSERPPAWLWRREWNLMRVTRRGTEPPSDWLEYNAGHYGFSLRLR